MTIQLPPHIESSIQAAVHSGHFASVDDAMAEAASLLLQRLKESGPKTTKSRPIRCSVPCGTLPTSWMKSSPTR